MAEIQTLCLIKEDNKLLLGMKKRGFGVGRWNGFGGKLVSGESVEESAIRELQEESGIGAKKLEKMGVLTFRGVIDQDIEVHLFEVLEYEGRPEETEEMKPNWFAFDQIPYASMWPDDAHWLPYFIEGKKVRAEFQFYKGIIKKCEISEVESFTEQAA